MITLEETIEMHQQSVEALALIGEFAYLETATSKAPPLLLPPLSTKGLCIQGNY